MSKGARKPLIVALDFNRLHPALNLVQRLVGLAALFKVGSQLFTAEGPEAVRQLAELGADIFLDLKFHDIPNTVAGAVAVAASLPGVSMLSIHALGGLGMMQAATKTLHAETGRRRATAPKLLAVTLLTSLAAAAIRRVGLMGAPSSRVVKLARLAQEAGLDGVVASPLEVAAIRRACGKDFLIVVPGVRPAHLGVLAAGRVGRDDQVRVATPGEAIQAGADYVVVGRPITAAKDPVAAARAILTQIEQARPKV